MSSDRLEVRIRQAYESQEQRELNRYWEELVQRHTAPAQPATPARSQKGQAQPPLDRSVSARDPQPKAQEDISMAQDVGRGLVRGTLQLGSAVGTGVNVMGWLLGKKSWQEAGQEVTRWFDDWGKQWAGSEATQGLVWDDPSKLLNPRWLAASVAETVPSLAATLVPGAGGAAAINLGGRAIALTAPILARLSRLGFAITGGAVGGFLEGSQTFQELKAKGATDEDAAKGLLWMGAAAAALNAFSLDRIIKGGKGVLGRFLTGGSAEAMTEMAEEPTDAVIQWLLDPDPNASLSAAVVESLKQSLNVGPAAFLTGGAAGAALGRKGVIQDPSPALEPAQVGGGASSTSPVSAPAPAVQEVVQAAQPAVKAALRGDLEGAVEAAQPVVNYIMDQIRAHVKSQPAPATDLLEALAAPPEGFRLPRELAGAKPRYRDAELHFASDLDKALYILAQSKKSKRDADYLNLVTRATGMTEAQARRVGQMIRGRLKNLPTDQLIPEIYQGPGSQAYAQRQPAPQSVGSAAAVTGQENLPASFRPDLPLGDTAIESPNVPRVVGATEERAGHLPSADIRVNTTYLGGPESVKNIIKLVNAANAERLKSDRAPKSLQRTILESIGRLTLEQALNLPDRALLNDAEVTALRDHVQNVADTVGELVAKAKQGDGEARAQIPFMVALAQQLERKREMSSRVTARTLNAHKIQSDALRAQTGIDPQALAALAEQTGPSLNMDVDAFLDAYDKLWTRKQKTKLIVNQGSGFWESVTGSVLWQAGTQVANFQGNVYKAVYAPVHRELASRMQFSANPTIAKGEAMEMIYSIMDGWREAQRLAGMAWRGESFSDFGFTKWGQPRQPAITAQRYGFDPESIIGKAIDGYGYAVRLPFRGLGAVDGFARGFAYQMEARALAYRKAVIQEGLEGEAAGKRVRQILDNIHAYPEIHEASQRFALAQIYQGELSKPGQLLQQAVHNTPGGRLFMLFTQVPIATTEEAVRALPGLNLISEDIRTNLTRPGAEGAAARATFAIGMMMSGTAAMLAAAGLITGGGPLDPERRAWQKETRPPYSVWVPGKGWISYRKFEPLALVLGAVADFAELSGELMEGNPAYQALPVAFGHMLGRMVGERELLQGLINILSLMHSPEKDLKKILQDTSQMLLPFVGALKSARRAYDPMIREVTGIMDEIKNSIPGWSKTLYPRVNRFGEEFAYQGGWGERMVNAVYRPQYREDKAYDEVIRLSRARILPDVGRLPKVLPGTGQSIPEVSLGVRDPREGIPLDDEQYYWFSKWAGEEAYRWVSEFVNSPGYDSLPDAEKALTINTYFQASTRVAQGKVLDRWPELVAAWDKRLREKYEKVYR